MNAQPMSRTTAAATAAMVFALGVGMVTGNLFLALLLLGAAAAAFLYTKPRGMMLIATLALVVIALAVIL